MKKTACAVRVVAGLLFLFFMVMIFSAINTDEGFLYEKKSVRIFFGLLLVIAYQACFSFSILMFSRQISQGKYVPLVYWGAFIGVAMCLLVYFYSVVPWSFPVVMRDYLRCP